MRTLFLGLTAMAAMIAVPAVADPHPRLVTGTQAHHDRGDGAGNLRDGRRSRGGSAFVTDVNGGEWALYNNRGWEPQSYNDWWHDRPDRAFPRWVQHSGDSGMCDQNRMWWSGAGWRC